MMRIGEDLEAIEIFNLLISNKLFMYTFYYYSFVTLQWIFIINSALSLILILMRPLGVSFEGVIWLSQCLISLFLAGASFIGEKYITKLYNESISEED